jgi:hypothetical protein
MVIERHKAVSRFALLLALAGCNAGESNSDGSTPNVAGQPGTGDISAPSERAAIFTTLELASVGSNQVINACDEAITPALYSVQLGGAVGTAVLVVLSGGDNNPSCYGMTGMEITLLKASDVGYKTLLSTQGQLGVLTTATNGVLDIAIGGPGFEFPVYSWNGATFERAGTIADTEFPIPVN